MRLGAFPVSIETKTYIRLARNAGRSALVALVRESLGGSRLVLGVDRLDYSMGIPQRVKAFERFLENNPEWHGKVTLLQITPKSRTEVEQYGEIEAEVTCLIGNLRSRNTPEPGIPASLAPPSVSGPARGRRRGDVDTTCLIRQPNRRCGEALDPLGRVGEAQALARGGFLTLGDRWLIKT